MISLKSNGSFTSAALLSALAASICCITPVIAIIAGSGSIASNFAWIAPARPYLIGLSIVVLAFAWYLKLKPVKSNNMDCCESKKPSFIQSKGFLGLVTVLAFLMMAFPLYAKIFYTKSNPKASVMAVSIENNKQVKFIIRGMTCGSCEDEVNNELSKVKGVIAFKTSYAKKSSLVTYNPIEVDIKTIQAAINKTGYTVKGYESLNNVSMASNISFYEAPLVCHAAPSIGCGSKAKFMLVDLEKNSNEVEGAWLNRTGTIVAVKWDQNTSAEKKSSIIHTVSTNHGIEFTELSSSETTNEAKTFPKGWYKGREVDKLSKEEASIIAQNTIDKYYEKNLIKPSFEKQFKRDIEKIYADVFLSISSYKDLSTAKYNEIENKIQAAGEKYVGKGKMPKVELCIADESCEKDKSCTEAGKSCCEKN
jgi:mercuric ion transport protein